MDVERLKGVRMHMPGIPVNDEVMRLIKAGVLLLIMERDGRSGACAETRPIALRHVLSRRGVGGVDVLKSLDGLFPGVRFFPQAV